MPLDIHTVERPDGDQSVWPDRSFMGHQFGITVAGGASPQTIAVSWLSPLPSSYMVSVELDLTVSATSAITASISSKTSTGFNVVLTGAGTTSTIPAGTMNVRVTG